MVGSAALTILLWLRLRDRIRSILLRPVGNTSEIQREIKSEMRRSAPRSDGALTALWVGLGLQMVHREIEVRHMVQSRQGIIRSVC